MRRFENSNWRLEMRKAERRAQNKLSSIENLENLSDRQRKKRLVSLYDKELRKMKSKKKLGQFFPFELAMSTPKDWVLGEDGWYVWDESVTSASDKDLRGRTYIGSGKNDAFDHWSDNLSWWDQIRESIVEKSVARRIDWDSFYTPILHGISAEAIERERKTYYYGDIGKTDWGAEFCVDKKTGFLMDDMMGELPTKLDVSFDFSLKIGNETIFGKASYEGVRKSRQYFSSVGWLANKIKPNNFDRGNAYSLILGNQLKDNVIVITFKNERDFRKVKEYIFLK